MRSLAFFIAVTSSLLASSLLIGCAAGDEGLTAIHADIVADHESVAQLSAKEYLKLDSSDVLLLDIREPEEYAVSRLSGAIRIDPNASAASVLKSGDIAGKTIIVYCSVGRRSSIFAEREQAGLMEMGAASVSNLENGIFGWHNEKRALVDARGKTDAVHPYDTLWKRYVERGEKARFTPIED